MMLRREFIKKTICFLSCCLLSSGLSANVENQPLIEFFKALLPKLSDAKTIGYFICEHSEYDIFSEIKTMLRSVEIAEQDLMNKSPAQFLGVLNKRIQKDFETDNVSYVNGWLLSITEIRLYKILYLV